MDAAKTATATRASNEPKSTSLTTNMSIQVPNKGNEPAKSPCTVEECLSSAAKMAAEMEQSRDSLLLLRVENAILMDELFMAGSELE